MHRSFSQFSGFLCVTVAAFTALSALSAPAHAQAVSMPELQTAQQAVDRADQADADQYAPDLLSSARSSLAQAQAAASNRSDRKRVPELALRATLDADLARARSNETVAKSEAQQRRQEIAELQRSLEAGGGR